MKDWCLYICASELAPLGLAVFQLKQRSAVLAEKRALLLDMNGTFMFGEDRFGDAEDFSAYYFKIGGTLPESEINAIIRSVYEFLDTRYRDEVYRHDFPSLDSAIRRIAGKEPCEEEMEKIAQTFAFHELGHVPADYAGALQRLGERFTLAAVIDIWSPKAAWLHAFEHAGIMHLFSAMSFSSDHGMVKPSPKPFELVLKQLGMTNTDAVVVGDSPGRDLGGARNAGIDCILVGGAKHPDALVCFNDLLELCSAQGMSGRITST